MEPDQKMNDQQPKPQYFEDFEAGATFEFTVPGLTPDEIKTFAAQYDPQRFHVDEKQASKTHFGGLVASFAAPLTGSAALVAGLLILVASFIRVRVATHRSDPYKDVQR